jgi:hypothetical protein
VIKSLEADKGVGFVRSLGPRPGVLGLGSRKSRGMSRASLSCSVLVPQGKKRGCAQCAHPGLRIGSYWWRIGPDSAGFRGSPALARAGTRFESHLGHGMTPRQRGFCFNVWTLSLRGSSDAVRGLCLAPRAPIGLCGWRGQGLAGGPSACWNLGMCRPFCCFRWPVVGRHLFMVRICGDDMTKPNLPRGSSSDGCLLRVRQSALIACLSGQRGCAHCAHLCARAAFRPAFWSLPPGSADITSCSSLFQAT